MSGKIPDQEKTYLNISDGKIRENVSANTPGAKQREVTNPSTGIKSVKNELVYGSVIGTIEDIYVREDDFGKMIIIIILDDELNRLYLSMRTNTGYAKTFLQRLPNVDFSSEIEIRPYKVDKDDKSFIGVSLYQCPQKSLINLSPEEKRKYSVENFYIKKVGDNITYVNNYPEFKKEWQDDKDEKKIYGIKVMKFLLSQLEIIREKITPSAKTAVSSEEIISSEINEDEVIQNDDDLPF